jgi:hypothetical protein
MADEKQQNQGQQAHQAQQGQRREAKDPTMTSTQRDGTPEYPEGTHPARPVSEVTHGADRLLESVRPASDDEKPDPSSKVFLQDVPEDFPGQGVPQSELDAAREGYERNRVAGDKRRGGE